MGTVLVVDDEPDILYVLDLLLAEAGYRVLKATNGAEALELALTHKPDFILSDWMMPAMDGLRLFWALKTTPRVQAIPIAFMSAANPPKEILDAGFLHKPFDIGDLFRLIERYVRRETA